MNNEADSKPKSVYAAAHEMAREQEQQARLLLWDQISERANTDDEYRRLLIENPKQAVQREASTLRDTTGNPITIEPSEIDAVADKAAATYKPIIPGAEPGQEAELIFGTINDIKRSFNLTLVLSQVLFYTGLIMIVAAFFVGLFSDKVTLSIFFGSGGIGSMLISSLLISPLNRVQNAAGDLVQLQMAYIAYYRQLTVLGTGRSTFTGQEAISITKEIDRAALSLMDAIEKFVEKGKKD